MLRNFFMAAAILVAALTSAFAGDPKNSLEIFSMKQGEFRLVHSWGSYSTNPDATSETGPPYIMIQAPDGKWHKGFPQAFSHNMSFVDEADTTFMVETSDTGGRIATNFYTYQDGEFVKRNSLPVMWENKTFTFGEQKFYEASDDASNHFAGFIYYEGGWKLARFEGREVRRIGSMTRDGENMSILHFDHYPSIRFDHVRKTFEELNSNIPNKEEAE